MFSSAGYNAEPSDDAPQETSIENRDLPSNRVLISKKVWMSSVETLDMSPRTFQALYSYRLTCLGDLLSRSESELLRGLPKLGGKSLREIIDALEQQGLRLRNDDEPIPTVESALKP